MGCWDSLVFCCRLENAILETIILNTVSELCSPMIDTRNKWRIIVLTFAESGSKVKNNCSPCLHIHVVF